MTKIITTLGPSSQTMDILDYFAKHSVAIGRLNFSHNVASWHIETGFLARKAGLELLVDLAGPKVLVGDLVSPVELQTGSKVIIYEQDLVQNEQLWFKQESAALTTIPCMFKIQKFVEPGKIVLIDDGKITLKVLEIYEDHIVCDVVFGGIVKNHKGINLPGSHVEIPFLVERDIELLSAVLPVLKPEYVAPSFVQAMNQLDELKVFMKDVLDKAGVKDYFPKICTKLEMAAAVNEPVLSHLIEESDMLMIARGDLALEAEPLNLSVPFYQEKIKKMCQSAGKPFVVATQMLESMMNSPVPTRAEVSDLYRAVVTDQADYIMLSGESAAGQFPIQCVNLMNEMVTEAETIAKKISQ